MILRLLSSKTRLESIKKRERTNRIEDMIALIKHLIIELSNKKKRILLRSFNFIQQQKKNHDNNEIKKKIEELKQINSL